MAKGHDLLRYITSQLVEYIETPRAERKQNRSATAPWTNQWFGLLPYSLQMWQQQKRHRYRGAVLYCKKAGVACRKAAVTCKKAATAWKQSFSRR